MRLLTVVLTVSFLIATTTVATAKEVAAYSAALGKFVDAEVLLVHATKMSEQNFCTLITGSDCNCDKAKALWCDIPQAKADVAALSPSTNVLAK